MFMQEIPTFVVEIAGKSNEEMSTFRVPENVLEDFIHVLLFNDVENIRIRKEDMLSFTQEEGMRTS